MRGEVAVRRRSGSEHATSEADALSPASSESSSAALQARSISDDGRLLLRRGNIAGVILPCTWQDFVRQHSEVLPESIVHLPVPLAAFATVGAGEATSPAERAQGAVGVAAPQLRLAHGGEDGR